jgi:tRNA(His) 5'-end guanylyltransferase
LKSTKHVYSCFFWNLACLVKVRRINKLSVVLKSFLKPAYPFARKSLVSAHWLMWDSRIIANTLAKTSPTVIPL